MALRFRAAHFVVVTSTASLFFELQGVRLEESQHDTPQVGLAKSNSSIKKLTLEDCNALLFTIISSTSNDDKRHAMSVIRASLFEKNGFDILALFMADGSYTIEVDQAPGMNTTSVGQSKLTLKKSETGEMYEGAFHLGGHKLKWVARSSGRFDWDGQDSGRDRINVGKEALSASCFLIVGSAFIAECLSPDNPDNFAKDAMVIYESAAVLAGAGSIDADQEIYRLIMGSPISDLTKLFSTSCGKTLRLSVGDIISPVSPVLDTQLPSWAAALGQSEAKQSRGKKVHVHLYGV
eukprot:TRINITY_DN5153_c0_g2_i1.p1 TRINITY_DN5153_c0_g2~~TRINITY_DN5153_c0_g2_i1.p1  ORF type:complete len:293 (-),score=38.46 TRINITY_DN5153_c0_g2_i1:211-1089(-)